MKATVRGIEVEGTVEEIAQLIFEIDKNKKLPPATTIPVHPIYEYHPPVYVTPLPSVLNPDPIVRPQVWCGGYTSGDSTYV
jgi:hypothetical protein